MPDRGARPPLVRPRDGRLLAGVAGGTAAHLRLDPIVVRVVFVGLAITGIGVVAYGLLWLTMPVAAPGGDAGGRSSPAWCRRPGRRQLLGLALLGRGGGRCGVPAGQLRRHGRRPAPAAGRRRPGGDLAAVRQPVRPRPRAARWGLAGGIALGVGGVVLLLVTTGQLANARNGFTATVVILVGITLATAPLWRRLLDQRAAERAAVIRSEERAAVAAHLHDSVLQTLALIQRHAEDPTVVGRLARSQERELRAWLYEPTVRDGRHLGRAGRAAGGGGGGRPRRHRGAGRRR